MEMNHLYEFGPFRLDAVNRLLLRGGDAVPLKQKAVDTLLVLVERRGEVVKKEELMKRLWPDTFVEEANLTQNIYTLRKALGEGEYILTIPRRGYRFAADVRVVNERTRRPLSSFVLLALLLLATGGRPARAPNPEAHRSYLEGRYFLEKRTGEGLRKSVDRFQKAIALDPNYAPAYSGLADAYVQLPAYGQVAPMEVYPSAKAAAARALELDDTLPGAHTSAAAVASYFEWNWTAAEREYRKALALNPNDAITHHRLGVQLAAHRRFREALAELVRAQRLEPLSLIINTILGFTYFEAGDRRQAIAQLRKTIEFDRNFPPAHEILGHVLRYDRQPDAAFAEYLEWRRLSGDDAQTLAAYRDAYGSAGLDGFFRKRLELGHLQPAEMAGVYALLGEKEHALASLEKAVEQHDGEVVWLRAWPDYDSIRTDPRFAKLLKRVNL